MKRIYLDYNASTPIDAEVAEAMRPFLEGGYGNPSSLHWAGRPAREAVETARGQVAGLLGCHPDEVVFTSGGSEASNFALKGTFYQAGGGPANVHFITSAVEHPATLEPLRFLERLGARLTVLPVDRFGRVDPAEVERAITPQTLLISIMHANNEVGTIEPIAEIARIARAHDVLFHTDAAQTVGKIPADVNRLGVDLMTVAAHKLYGPKGVGALFVRRGVKLTPLVHGAGHENGRRAGTENVLLIAGLGKACEIAARYVGASQPPQATGPAPKGVTMVSGRSIAPAGETPEPPATAAIRELRDYFESELTRRFGDRVTRNGHPEHRLPNTASVNFAGRVGADILARLDQVAASTGSACHAGSVELSPVLKAMGVPPEAGMGAIRFSLGRPTTRAEIDEVLEGLSSILG